MTENHHAKQSITGSGQRVGPLLSEGEVAAMCGLSTAAIRRWRLLGKGPRYIKVGAAVRYPADGVTKWLETRPSGGEPVPEVQK